jgi:hypothetical protein
VRRAGGNNGAGVPRGARLAAAGGGQCDVVLKFNPPYWKPLLETLINGITISLSPANHLL